MSEQIDRCKQLRKLHDRIVAELDLLRENIAEEEEQVGWENPIEMSNVIKSLQAVLHTIHLELEKCPPEG